MTPGIRNVIRWAGAIITAFAVGAGTSLLEGDMSTKHLVVHGVAMCIPTVVALKMQLEKSLGINPNGQSKPPGS